MTLGKRIAGKKVLVLGIGNILMTDEGLGVRALEAVRDGYCLPPGVRCVDGGTMGLALLEYIKEFPSVIIIDALKSGSRPGTILRICGKDIPAFAGLRSSAHGLGVKELITLAEFEGVEPPEGAQPLQGACPNVTVTGMEPKDVSPGLVLTPLIKKRLPSLIKTIIKELRRLGVILEEK
ncbi:MAG: HyaD/HybD family hydrogenase maturation endopeptidase [Deltaproteobacteria bacterium]|nr:HyaD/HybD family hydrogenase maturation endopeptidase [Deltaproteobacteria bacterium]